MPAADAPRGSASREGIGGDHRLHLGDRRLSAPSSSPNPTERRSRSHRRPELALWGFFVFYVTCVAITWSFYTRSGGLLHDIERGRPLPPAAAQPAE